MRVEGHIGMELTTAMAKVKKLQLTYNLAFDLVAVKIAPEFNDETFQFKCLQLECDFEEYETVL